MKFRYFFSFAIICLFGLSRVAEAQEFIVKGVVFEKGANARVALANIQNQRTKIGVTSNDLGLFQLKVAVGDTLLIAKTFLNDQRIVIKAQQDILIYLTRSSTMLNEVTIIGNTKKSDLAEIKREFQNKGVYNGGKSSFLSAIFNPLNGLYNLVGKEPKNARRFSRYADNEIKQSQIDVYFNQSIIKNNTSLRGDTLENYMLNYRPDYQKAQSWSSYDYIKYIKDSAKKFTDTLGKGK
ncbi:carboxypeptidase-like regulatory domain-containing protein [Pedobacter sp. Leaf176]|uniref:carboxypeptidase-like regulatory domain-containing protein n=1 Tax=Pedobacter sp. Leaf176 TaxID=1736286 RepID=UPI0006FAC7D9|nr:carboxypeptidase-like regulatory domain-containing protein [Pedobacter sp. Leaf176]KQR72213.1 hypothetical protein ASF92_02645 [Pedobacter sp. Leaf176]